MPKSRKKINFPHHRFIETSRRYAVICAGRVSLPSPSGCSQGLEWRVVKAKNTTSDSLGEYTVLACKGTGSINTCTAPQLDIERCNNAGNTWKAEECCCSGTKELVFLDAAMCSGSNIICNADKTITSAAAVCNEFASDSAECICANGNLKQCVGKVYGAGSDEAGCVQSGENHEACNCEFFTEFQSNFKNYACVGIPAQCEGSTYQPCSSATMPKTSEACGNCGVRSRTVTCNTSLGTWTEGSWGNCTGEGSCSPGSKKMVMCGTNTGYQQGGTESFVYKEVTCSTGCAWPNPGSCNVCTESPNCGKSFGNGQVGACYCTDTATRVCDLAETKLCTDCGGAWNPGTCTCNCGTYLGVSCSFTSSGCLCDGVLRSCGRQIIEDL